MDAQNYISPENKRQIEKEMKALKGDFIWYTTEIINEWFNMTYPNMEKVNKKRHEYIRLLCQYLWRHIADSKGITDYSESIAKLKNMFKIE